MQKIHAKLMQKIHLCEYKVRGMEKKTQKENRRMHAILWPKENNNKLNLQHRKYL